MDRLIQMDQAGRLRYLGSGAERSGAEPGAGDLAVELAGQVRELPGKQMLDWLAGFTAAEGATRQPPERRDPAAIATVRAVLINPTLTDQTRIMIRAAMERSNVGVVELARRTGVTKKSITEALLFGKPGTLGLTAVLGLLPGTRQSLADPGARTPLTPVPPRGWAEPTPLHQLRLLGYAHEQGVVHWPSPVDVNKALYARVLTVLVGEILVRIPVAALGPWLTGVADVVAPDVAQQIYAALTSRDLP